MKELFEIDKEFILAQELSERNNDDFLLLDKYKRKREIYILGSFKNLLEKGGVEFSNFAKYKNPPDPDFHIFKNKLFYKQIEIVENLHWSRKRGFEKIQDFDESKYLDPTQRCKIRLWYSLIKNLRNKFNKHYGNNSWLVMYHNIPILHISDKGFWTDIYFSILDEIKRKNIIDFSKSPYEKIFVINASFKELILIYPDYKIVYSKHSSFSRY